MSTYGRETPDPEPRLSPAGHADAAAEAIRALNHATITRGYLWPADVDAVVGALTTLAQRLPQALAQADAWLVRALDAGRVGNDRDHNTSAIIAAVADRLDDATGCAQDLAAALGRARTLTATLTGLAPDPAVTPTNTTDGTDGTDGTDRIGGAR